MANETNEEKVKRIKELFDLAGDALEEARVLSEGVKNEHDYSISIYYEGPEYGMGGYLRDGEWNASAGSC